MRKIFFITISSFLLLSCGNTEYFEGIAIPARQSSRGDYGLVNLKGELVVDFFIDQKPSLMVDGVAHYKKNGEIIFINTEGKEIKTKFTETLHFNEEKALVRREDGKLAFIDKSFNEFIRLDDVESAGNFSEGLFKFKDEATGLWGFKDSNGSTVIKPNYNGVSAFSEGLALVHQIIDKEKQYGFVDQTGKIVFPLSLKYQSIGSFKNGYAIFERNDFKGVLNKNFEEVFKSDEWREIYPFSESYTTVEGNDREFGLIDTEGKYVIKTREKIPLRFYNGLSLFYNVSNRRGGFMDIERKVEIRPEFIEGLPFLSNGAWVKDGSQWAYIDKDGDDVKSATNLKIRNLFHEGFSESLFTRNSAINLDATITATFYDFESMFDYFIDPDSGIMFDFNNTLKPEYFDELYKKFVDQDTYKSIALDENLIAALPAWEKRMDSYRLFESNLNFDKNFQFRLRHTFKNPIKSKKKEELSEINELQSIRLNLSLKNKARNKGSEIIDRITSSLEEKNFELIKESRNYKTLANKDKTKTFKISRNGNYLTIEIDIVSNTNANKN